MKAIIPVAGSGTRLRPHTLTKPKVLMNVAGKPMIYYIIEQLIREQIVDEIILIVGTMSNKIIDYVTGTFDFKFSFPTQQEAIGLGHAISCAKGSIKKNEDVLIILGDTLFDVNLRDLTDCEHSVIGLKKVQDPRRFGVAEIRDNRISGFVEKPASKDVSPSNDAIVGIYYLKNSDKLFDSLDKLINKGIKTKGEFQLTDALTLLLESGEKFCPYYVDGWLDCGKVETILETNSYLLHKFNLRYKIPGALIKDPVFIGANTVLDNCIIGENVTVGNHCIIRNSIIKNSIIDDYATIENSILANTLVGEHSVVSGKMKELNIGDYSETID